MAFKSLIEKIAPLTSGFNNSVSPQRVYAESVLSTWEASPSLASLFFVVFNFASVNALKNSNVFLNSLEDYALSPWDIPSASLLISDNFQANTRRLLGCIFAQEIEMPGEALSISQGNAYGGHFGRNVFMDRNNQGVFKMTFLETNSSFVDLVIRPWLIMVGHFGLVARPSTSVKNVKCSSVLVYELAKNGPGNSLIVRKQTNFFKVVPISIDGNTPTQSREGYAQRSVKFAFDGYSVSDGAAYR